MRAARPGRRPVVPVKTHRSAAVVIPPQEAWEPIQRIRLQHDRQVRRWMPHINVLYPFHDEAEWAEHRVLLARAAACVQPFTLTLRRFRSFDHGRGRYTAWLEPEPAAPLQTLFGILAEEFDDCDDLARQPGGYSPHLSVGQFGDPIEDHLAALQRAWQPLRFEVRELAVITRGAEGPFRVRARFALGSPAA